MPCGAMTRDSGDGRDVRSPCPRVPVSSSTRARMLRRVQTTQHAGIEPMRLSWRPHDSIERDDHRTRVLSEDPGVVEARALEAARTRVMSQNRGVGGPEDASNIEMALRASRQAWCDMGAEQMALAYERSLQSMTEDQMIEMAKQASVALAARGGSTMEDDLKAAIAASMRDTPQSSEEQLLQEALRVSQSTSQIASEEDQIRQAMEISMASSTDQVGAAMEASILEATRRQHEEEELKRTIEMSRQMADDEAFQIQQAWQLRWPE